MGSRLLPTAPLYKWVGVGWNGLIMAKLSRTLHNSLPLLQALLETESVHHYSQLIQNKQLQNSISEITRNLLESNLPIAKKYRGLLRREESTLTVLAAKSEEKLSVLSSAKGKKVLKLLLRATLPILKRHVKNN